jgi:hypothetical protein
LDFLRVAFGHRHGLRARLGVAVLFKPPNCDVCPLRVRCVSAAGAPMRNIELDQLLGCLDPLTTNQRVVADPRFSAAKKRFCPPTIPLSSMAPGGPSDIGMNSGQPLLPNVAPAQHGMPNNYVKFSVSRVSVSRVLVSRVLVSFSVSQKCVRAFASAWLRRAPSVLLTHCPWP